MQSEFDVECYATSEADLPTDLQITSDAPTFRVAVVDEIIEELEAGIWLRRVRSRLSFRTPNESGAFSTQLTASYHWRETTEHHRLAVSGFVQSSYEVTPRYVFFGELDDQKTVVRKSFIIRGGSGQILRIEGMSTNCPSVKTDVRHTKDGALVTLTLDPTKVSGSITGEVRLTTNLEKEKIIVVPFAAIVSPAR
jgi:hypothetical protein